MREYGRSADTRISSDSPLSCSRMVRMAFRPAVPPPTMTCRLLAMAGVWPSRALAPHRRAGRGRALSLPEGRRGSHAWRGAPGRELAEPVGRLPFLVEDSGRWACGHAGRVASADVALEGLLRLVIEEDRPVGAG